jgi:hypothetical protein
MRTDLFRLPALAAGALLALGAAALSGQDTLRAGAAALRHVPDRVVVNGDLTIAPDEVVDGRAVVMRGNLRVLGRVAGSATVASGNLVLEPGARVDGDVHVTGGGVQNRGTIGGDAVVVGRGALVNSGAGLVRGEMRVVDAEAGDARRSRAEARAAAAFSRIGSHRLHRSFGPVWEGFSGLASTLSLGLVLAALGAALAFYAYPRLESVSDALRADPARAAGVGIAAGVLTLPAFIVMVVALCITIIGIPLLVAAVPAFMLLVGAAAAMGLVAVAHALGERTAELNGSMEPHRRNGYTYVFTGLGLLLAPLAVAHLLQMTGFLNFLGDLLAFFASVLLWIAAMVGAGAVILTRAGGWWKWPPRRAHDPILDADPFAGMEPATGGGDV